MEEVNIRRNKNGLLDESFIFHRRVIQCYRYEQPKVEVLCLPLFPNNPTTSKGTVNVMLRILINGYLLFPNYIMLDNMPYFIPPQNIIQKYLLVIGNGLSHKYLILHSNTLPNIILEASYNEHYL